MFQVYYVAIAELFPATAVFVTNTSPSNNPSAATALDVSDAMATEFAVDYAAFATAAAEFAVVYAPFAITYTSNAAIEATVPAISSATATFVALPSSSFLLSSI